jgi:predicted amidohydrolase YtcJ
MEDALTAYTAGVGYQSFEDDRGVLTVGSRADVVVLDRDILAGPLESVHEARVLRTWCGGRPTYRSST